MTTLLIRGPVAGMTTPVWGAVLTRAKTRVFEGRYEFLLHQGFSMILTRSVLTWSCSDTD